jgi:hypothetical protein
MFFDIIRNKSIKLTPEEVVRQFIIKYFIEKLKFPKCLFSVESEIRNSSRGYRTDILIHNNMLEPVILVECKSMKKKLDCKSLLQLFNYNRLLNTKYVIISNLKNTYCFYFNKIRNEYINTSLPKYSDVKYLFK